MLNNVLPAGSRARSIAISAACLLAALIYVQVILPGTPGGGRGTPMAILFNGMVNGCAYALTAIGLVLVYRSLRIINFAQVALGAVGGRLFFEFMQYTPVPFPIAIVVSVAAGAAVGWLVDITFGRRFFTASRVVMTTVTIALLPFLGIAMSSLVPSLPIFPRKSSLSVLDQAGAVPSRPFLPFAAWHFHVGKYNSTYGFPEILNIELLVFGLLAVICFLRYTRAGVAVRALSENSERASLLGIPVGSLSSIVWMVSAALGTLTVIGLGALTSPAAGAGSGVSVPLMLLPLTAAVLAGFTSIPIAVFSSLVMATVANSVTYSYPADTGLLSVGYFVLVAVVLVVQRRRRGRSEEGSGVAWEAVKEPRPIPKEMAKIGTVRTTRWVLIAVAALFVLLYPLVTPARYQFLGGTILLQSIIGVSLVVLTGWAGQISLAQFAIAAIGAAVAGSLTARHGIPFWFAVPIASAVSAAFAALIGIPALRLKGLFLGVTTLALAIATSAVLFDEKYFGWLLPKGAVDRPSLFFLNFNQDRPMYYLSMAALVLAIVVTLNLRRSRFGRLLIAMRENEANVQSFGVSATRLKITSFAVSGALAGFAGAMLVHQQRGLDPQFFLPQRSLDVFLFTVIGGVGSVGGALLGSLLDNFFRFFASANDFLATATAVLQGGGIALFVLFLYPGGLISVAIKIRDAWLRIIAQRRQIVVPSLFADYDPAALERRLIPLADADSNSGLAALGPGAHFRLGSELHGGAGSTDQRALRGREEERLAIGAAAASVGDVDADMPHDVVGSALVAAREES
ncbi:MAG: branched-chain amino acid transport system permease protein livM [Actinomycetota bacterium]|jgi:branched-chain amino acid transport system permease protein